MRRIRVGIDTGGTFTDVVALDESTGALTTTKTPSTPNDPSQGFMAGLHKIAERGGFSLPDLASVAHGTTIATNAVLSHEGALPGLGLIVTRGFRHLLEIARQSVPHGYGNSYFWVKPERIVPLHLVAEVDERLDFRGTVLRPFDDTDARRVADWCRGRGLTAIGVCLLHAYANPDHERRMRDLLQAIHPDASVSISSDVLPEYREYERAVTTLIDAFVKPRIARYVERIQVRLTEETGRHTPFYIMKSNGGVVSATEVAAQPITTLLSGPAAGALGAALLASAAGFPRVLTLDGGGTSTDVALVEDGSPHTTTQGQLGSLPIKVPMIDLVTVGAGGGSIARRAVDGRLRVGPESAGAAPGPLCYDRGGDEPTVTDAALVLGWIPARLLGGEMALDVAAARRGLGRLAESLGMQVPSLALGILEIAAWNQANAVRRVTVRRGIDLRDYTLVAFGGSGPLQAGRLLDVLGLKAALIPLSPGNVSAFGLLTVDLKNDYVATAVSLHAALDLHAVEQTYARLERQARTALEREGFSAAEMLLSRSADLRYFGQAWEVQVDVPGGRLDRAAADVALHNFHHAHERAYGYSYREAQPAHAVEWVNLRVTGVGPIQRPALHRLARSSPEARAPAPTAHRLVCFGGDFAGTPLHARDALRPGDSLMGPTIVEEFGSTTVVPPGVYATVDDLANLVLRRIDRR
jgi:N-methylhydantoinase A